MNLFKKNKKPIESIENNKKLFKCHFEVTRRDNTSRIIETRRVVEAVDKIEATNLGHDVENQFHDREMHIIKFIKVEEITLEEALADKQCRSNIKFENASN